ncbi:MAG: hypothetical protein ACXVDD_01370 [Polyangia bacterium]
MKTLAELARANGLPKCARVIESSDDGLPPAPAPDRALAATLPKEPVAALGLLTRRGLDPNLLAVIRPSLGPVERGLVAWDVLNSALLPPAGLVDELRADAKRVGALLPKPGHVYPLILPAEIDKLIEQTSVPALRALDEPARRDAIARQALGALRLGSTATDKQLELARQTARVFHRSHLSSVAAVQLADLFFHHRYRPALPDLVEVLLDRDATSVAAWLGEVSDPAPGDPSMAELLKYVQLRTAIIEEKWDVALAHADQHRATFDGMPRERAVGTTPRLVLAFAEAALRNGRKTLPFEHVAAITSLESPWRYAYRVMTVYAASVTHNNDFVAVMQRFLETFGNDFHTWYDSVSVSPDDATWGPGFYALVHREAATLPHEAAVWRVLPLMLGGDGAQDAYDEIEARLKKQATLG